MSTDLDKLRREAILAAERQAFDTGHDCPTCGGTGTVRSDDRREMLVHVLGESTLGADWTLDAVVDLIAAADRLEWSRWLMGHDLLIVAGGRTYRAQVRRPQPDQEPARG